MTILARSLPRPRSRGPLVRQVLAGVCLGLALTGAARAERFTNPMLSPGSHDFGTPPQPQASEFAYRGGWRITLDSATVQEARATGGKAASGRVVDVSFRPVSLARP